MSGKVRVPNFTTSEKFHLLRIISNKYASIIEDKKTNRASAEKDNTWQQITDDFNASSSTGILRSTVSLKKCYENRKKELRKTLADEKREVTLTGTGGGPPPKIKRDDTDELLMSILNKNTLMGFHNNFDDDADDSSIVYRDPDENNVVEFYIADGDIVENTDTSPGRETFLPMDKTNQSMAAKKHDVNWRKYNATKLQDPISPALVTNLTTLKKEDTNGNVPSNSKYTPQKSRRRPTTVIKSLTSSDIAKKYDLLLDKRLILLEKQLNHMEEENALLIRQRKLEIEILETDLLSKKKNVE